MKTFFLISSLMIIYLTNLYLFKPDVYTYKTPDNLIENYLRSQDIPHEVNGRIFLSDGDIHIASGILYLKGEDPTKYNFQHPPLIKYIYGLFDRATDNPLLGQIFLGCIMLFSVFFISKHIAKNFFVSFFTCLLLIIDPLFLDLSSNALLDLGQSALMILYIYVSLQYEKKWILKGTILGLVLGSKFWGMPLFFVLIITLYKWRINQLKDIKSYLFHIVFSLVIFTIIYTPTFIANNGNFNFVFFQLKTLKYWLNHSISSFFGSSLILFFTGFFKTWWGSKQFEFSGTWSPLWPVSLILSTVYFLNCYRKFKKINDWMIISILPFSYLLYLGFQAPFTRYFIVILPFLYLLLSKSLFDFYNSTIYKSDLLKKKTKQ